jgi:hypothetical protein
VPGLPEGSGTPLFGQVGRGVVTIDIGEAVGTEMSLSSAENLLATKEFLDIWL